MKNSTSSEEGVRNLDRILPSRANSTCSNRKFRGAICSVSSASTNNSLTSPRSPFPLDLSERQWILSSSHCQLGSLKEILSAEPKFIDKKDFFTGYSALHWAAKEGKSELLHWICDAGAEVNIRTNGGYTPLHLAVMHCQALIVDILISDYDADINVRDYSGRKPGHYVQSDMPTWVQRALRTNQGTKDGSQIDALVMSTTANLAVMHGKPVSRSWSSIKAENVEEKPDVVVKSRTKSIIRSFRKIKNRDKHPASRENILKAKEIDSKDPARSQSRSLSVPDISLTPRSKKKLLQIEHPHFDDSDLLSNKSCTDVSEAVKSDCSDLDDVFSDEGHNGTKVTYPDQIDSRTDGNRHTSDVKYDLKSKNCKSQQDEKDVVGKSYVMAKVKKDEPDPGRWRANVISNADVMTKATTNCAESMINENVSQWKATTLV